HFGAQFQLANTYYTLGEADAALEAYQKALDLRPSDPTVSANYGGLLFQLGMIEEAEKVYRAALKQSPDSRELSYNLGLLLLQNGQQPSAKELILRAEQLGLKVPTEVRKALQSVE